MTRTSDSPRSHDQTAMDNFDDSTKVSRVSSSPSLRRPFLSAERARLLPGTRAGACACQRVRPQHDEHVLGQVSVSHRVSLSRSSLPGASQARPAVDLPVAKKAVSPTASSGSWTLASSSSARCNDNSSSCSSLTKPRRREHTYHYRVQLQYHKYSCKNSSELV